jgi:hypothetical protein
MIEFGYYALNKKNSIITNEQQLNSKLTVPVIRFIVSLVFIIALIFLRKWPNKRSTRWRGRLLGRSLQAAIRPRILASQEYRS